MRKCPECKARFKPKFTSLQATCGALACAIAHGKKEKISLKKKESAAFKKKVRDQDRSWHLDTCQKEFNTFIRNRDRGHVCISCQKPPKKKNAGHYRSRGACPELRFHEDNCHLQCEHCNSFKSGNIGEYRINLIRKIGLAKVEWIEGPHEQKKYTIPELKEMISHYRKLNKLAKRAA